jgi:adenine-specific DNA glycosylase
LAHRRGRYLLEQRPNDAARWAGLWQFPNAQLEDGQTALAALRRLARASSLEIAQPTLLTSLAHSITRYRIELSAHYCRAEPMPTQPLRKQRSKSTPTRRWVSVAELGQYPLPAPHAKIAAVLRAEKP